MDDSTFRQEMTARKAIRHQLMQQVHDGHITVEKAKELFAERMSQRGKPTWI